MDLSVYLGAFSKAFEYIIPFLYWFIPVLFLVTIFKSPWFKGIVGEWIVNLLIKKNFKLPEYTLFKDILLPTEDGTTQIDHILVSPFGLFVIETKNMKGWIFGSEKQAKWTQQIYKHKSSFQNPLRQNYKHCKVIQDLLGLDDSCIQSVVVFVGESVFKTQMPKNVIRAAGLKGFIKSFNTRVLDDNLLADIKLQLKKGKLDSTFKNKRSHVKHVKEIVKNKEINRPKSKNKVKDETIKATAEGIKQCPRCGSLLKLKVATKGTHKGAKFYGCETFPKCRYLKKLS